MMVGPFGDGRIAEAFRGAGVVLIEYALTDSDLSLLGGAFAGEAGRRHSSLSSALVSRIAHHPALGAIASELAGTPARLVRVVAFDKTPGANWFVPWHQDRTVALACRADAPGFERWTVKDGLVHAEPPVALLERMLTLRIHLDDCDENSGPLEVVTSSHLGGRLDRAAVESMVASRQSRLCLAARGDILAMRPLLLHRSQRARTPTRRRVLHLEYATASLPPGLRWAIDATTPGALVH